MPSPSKSTALVPLAGQTELFHVFNVENSGRSENGLATEKGNVLEDNPMAPVLADKQEVQIVKMQEIDTLQGTLSGLVKEWSTISLTFHRRDSCEFTSCVAPCVRKAAMHLQHLKDKLARLQILEENTTRGVEDILISGEETPATVFSESRPTTCSDTKFPSSDASSIELSSLSSLSKNTSCFPSGKDESPVPITSSAFQDIQIAITPASLVKRTNMQDPKRPNSAIYQLGYNVVEEVIRLLARIEQDRLNTQEKLVKETQRVHRLRSQIDATAFKRLIELPAAVQKEHESCATDINELKWHCAYQGRLEARLKRRVDHAELQYSKLIGELESSKENCPLVREKLELEDLAMASIQSKQDETDEKLRQSLKRLEATQRKTNDANTCATNERMLVKKDVDIFRISLNQVSDELAQLKMNYTSNVHTISDIKNTFKENAEQCVNLEKREERVKSQEVAQQEKVVKLRERIGEQATERARLLEENEKLKRDKQTKENEYNASITKMEKEMKQCELLLRELSRKNKTLREDLDSMAKKTEKCKKRRVSDKKTLVRSDQELEKVKQNIEIKNEESKKLKALNFSLKNAKGHEEEEYFADEDALRSAEQLLTNQLKEDSHSRTILQARIATDTSDLMRSRIDSKKKRDKIMQQAVDSEKIVSRIREQVEKLEKVHEERQQAVSQINEVVEKLRRQREEMESRYRTKIVQLSPLKEKYEQEKQELEQKIDHIQWQTDMMTKKMKDMAASSIMMSRVISTSKEDIKELEEDDKEVKLCLGASNYAEKNVKEALEAATERFSLKKEEHISHTTKLREVLEQTLKVLDEKLAENRTLAETYQRLHNHFLQQKDLFFKKYERLVNEESHLKDHKELFTLQNRLRDCLQHYYNLRGLQNKSHVAQFRLSSKENNEKLFHLQRELSDVVTHINNFLESASDAHETISLEAAKMQQTPMMEQNLFMNFQTNVNPALIF